MKTVLPLALLAILGLASTAKAQYYLVNTDTSYTSTSQYYFNTTSTTTATGLDYANPTQTDAARYVNFGTEYQQSSVGGPDPYATGSPTYTSVAYGGYQIDENNSSTPIADHNAANAYYVRSESGTPSSQQLIIESHAANALSMSSAFNLYVPASNFLNGFNSAQGISLQDITLSLNIVENRYSLAGTSYQAGLIYFTVESNGDWYVAATPFALGAGTFSLANANASTYYAYTPNTNQIFDSADPGTAVLGSTLTDVQAFGVLAQDQDFDGQTANASGQVAEIVLNDFQVTSSVAAPEPSTMALGIFGLGGLLTILRRKSQPRNLI